MEQDRSAEVLDLHRQISIGLLKSVECFSVRTPRGQKDPGHFGWDPKTNSIEHHKQNITRFERGDDNLGIHLFGKYIDVDVDTDNPLLIEAVDYFLPSTPHVWGRGDRKRTHRLYELSGLPEANFDPNNFGFLAALAKREDLKLEVRGGIQRAGRYTLLPGSLHPSGDTYQWDDISSAKSTPVSIDVYRVMDSLRFAMVATLIAPYWTEGMRNNLCMALSGFFHRAAKHVEDMGDQASVYFGKNEAQSLLEGIMYIADDDEADRQMRLRTFNQTWDKAESGEAVTGATTITKLTGDEELLSLLYILLSDSPDLVELDRFLERYAVRNNTSNVIDLDRAGSKEASFIMTVNDFRNSYMHKYLTSGLGRKTPMTNILLASPRAIRIDGFTFEPKEGRVFEENGYVYVNQWRGWAVEPADNVELEEVSTFTSYVYEILADKRADRYNWIMAWLADIVQNPSDKCGTALVLVGKPGAGKSVLGEAVMRKIIGPDHSMQTNTLESITGNFNSDSASMLLVQCDEAANTRRHSDANKMKSIITDKTRRVEPKNVNAYQIRDCARYILTSNQVNDAVAIVDGKNDRRYAVFQVNDDYSFSSNTKTEIEKKNYWGQFHKWCSDRTNLAKVHRFLADLKYDRDIIRSPIDTEARRLIQQHSMRGMEEWLMGLVSSEHPFDTLPKGVATMSDSFLKDGKSWRTSMERWPDAVPYRTLVESYNYYRRKNGVTNSTPAYNEQQLKNEFIRRGLIPNEHFSGRVTVNREEWVDGEPREVKSKVRITQVPKKEVLIDYLEKNTGFEFADTDEEIELGDEYGNEEY